MFLVVFSELKGKGFIIFALLTFEIPMKSETPVHGNGNNNKL